MVVYNHWSEEKNLKLNINKKYTQGNTFKPSGLWFDCNEEWLYLEFKHLRN